MTAPPGEYERVLLRFGCTEDGAGGAVTAVTLLDTIAPHIQKVACSNAHCLVLTHRGELFLVPTTGLAQSGAGLPTPLELGGQRVADIAAGNAHFLALSTGGKVFGWGSGEDGQVGTGSLKVQPTPRLLKGLDAFNVVGVAAGAAHSIAWTDAGFAYGFGRGEQGQLGMPNTLLLPAPHRITALLGRRIMFATAKGNATAFLDDEGKVWVCGEGTTGLLGQGHFRALQSPAPLPLPEGVARVLGVSIGWGHLVLRDDCHRVWACGTNTKGQLGHGEATSKYATLQRVAVHKRVPAEERALELPGPLRDSDAESGLVPPLEAAPVRSPQAEAPSLSVAKVCAGEFWTGALSDGALLLWGSFGPSLSLHTSMECLNDYLPPHATVADVWPQQDSALVLVDLFVRHYPVDLHLKVATLGDLNLAGAKEFALQRLAKLAPQMLVSASDTRHVDITVALKVLGGEPSWSAVVAGLTGSPTTQHSIEQGEGHVLLHLPPDAGFLMRILQAEEVGGYEVVIAQCFQTVTVTLHGPVGRLEKTLERCQGAQSEQRQTLPPLYTIVGYTSSS
eukprot:GGOE01041107.1.p1 GENE.GGOE01041107.1~~GGOE01041107.1.p1  ORF type:complete len:563 (+),score=139.97 GGOE01041107.1:67-1755(+)